MFRQAGPRRQCAAPFALRGARKSIVDLAQAAKVSAIQAQAT
jgi:hypothetical protein